MDITEMKKRKAALEEYFLSEVKKFETETGLLVSQIEFVNGASQSVAPFIIAVKIITEMP